MATRDELFPSKYLSASDLGGKGLTLKIAEANVETLKALDGRESTKIVLYFHKFKKLLPLNRTNFDSVCDITGEADTENWPGCAITVYPAKTSMAGKIVDCVRIKQPNEMAKAANVEAQQAPPAQNYEDPGFDDEMPPY